MIVDTHAHLTDEHFKDIGPFLDLANQAGVTEMLTIATTLDDSRACLKLAESHSSIRCAVGIHPNNCCQAEDGDWAAIEQMVTHDRVAALGETGLDKYWDDCPWDVQVEYFRRHLALSRETKLPVVIHTRECAEETLEILREESGKGPLIGVMHSFTGPLSVAKGCLELGLYISFAGMVSFKNASDIREIARQIPTDRILVETDSPYLTPHPHRGKRPNHPAMVVHTLQAVADARNELPKNLARQTTENAHRLFGKW